MKWLVRVLAVFGTAVAVTAAASFLWLRTSLPQIDGTIRLAGLTQEIEILRDEHGVPHIFAASEDDAYFALGFVHAQDRLWQMEIMRLAGAGRLAIGLTDSLEVAPRARWPLDEIAAAKGALQRTAAYK